MKFGTNVPRGRRHIRAKCPENLEYRSSAITDRLLIQCYDCWPAVAYTGFRASSAITKRLVRLTWNLEDTKRAPSCLCLLNFVRIVARVRERQQPEPAGQKPAGPVFAGYVKNRPVAGSEPVFGTPLLKIN